MKRHALDAGERSRTGYAGYMNRKVSELALIERRLANPSPAPHTSHLASLFQRKFKSAALCRAEMAAEQWSQTETKWKAGPCGSGAFRFDYEYQRADLSVDGPPAYSIRALADAFLPTQHTTSGMAALSAALLAMRRIWPGCTFEARSDGYPETLELIDLLHNPQSADGAMRIVIVDSTVDTAQSARARMAGATAVVFDTSCFAASSSRIGAIVTAAAESRLPMILIRSHTKLDCFGLDYGRLGSVVVTKGSGGADRALDRFVADFIRLTGSAALPLHFPPFAGGDEFRSLSRARTAWTIRCTRLIQSHLRRATAVDLRSFAHGLYIVFNPAPYSDKDAASVAAEHLVGRLVEAGIPARHAGSFGFDFFGCDWFEDPETGRIGLRLSVGDLPLCLVDRAIVVIESWLDETAGNGPRAAVQTKMPEAVKSPG